MTSSFKLIITNQYLQDCLNIWRLFQLTGQQANKLLSWTCGLIVVGVWCHLQFFPASSPQKLLHLSLSDLVYSFLIKGSIKIPHCILIRLFMLPQQHFELLKIWTYPVFHSLLGLPLQDVQFLSFGLLSVNNCCHSNTFNFGGLKHFGFSRAETYWQVFTKSSVQVCPKRMIFN